MVTVHPHTRGEHQQIALAAAIGDGSSPHPWGTHKGRILTLTGQRFIPTPVGNTKVEKEHLAKEPVHPHTRGEHQGVMGFGLNCCGSSPHPWGTHIDSAETEIGERFIPTPVGNTTSAPSSSPKISVHPHTRGEHFIRKYFLPKILGSSPHPWGTPRNTALDRRDERFIPTPVGNTFGAG